MAQPPKLRLPLIIAYNKVPLHAPCDAMTREDLETAEFGMDRI